MKLLLILYLQLHPISMFKSPFEIKQDSIALANLEKNFNVSFKQKDNVFMYVPTKYVKFTFKTGYNQSMSSIVVHKGLDGMQDELSGEDYFNLTQYDFRAKVYVNKRFRITNRVLLTGIYTKKYSYQTGISYKF